MNICFQEDLLSSGEDSRSSSAPVAVSHSLPSVPSYHSTPYETPAYEASPYRAPSPHHTVPYDPTPYSGRYSAAASDPIPAAVHSYGYSAGMESSKNDSFLNGFSVREHAFKFLQFHMLPKVPDRNVEFVQTFLK